MLWRGLLPLLAAAKVLWQHGNLTVLSDFSWHLNAGGHAWSGSPVSGAHTSSATRGHDWLGTFEEFLLGSCSVRYYCSLDAFVFKREYDGSTREPLWPQLAPPTALPSMRAVGWNATYMLKGNAFKAWDTEVQMPTKQYSNGPLFLFSNDAPNLNTLAISAIDFPSINTPTLTRNGSRRELAMTARRGPFPNPHTQDTPVFDASTVPAHTAMRTLLLCRPGLKRATMAWGAVMRMYHNSTRNRGSSVTQLSYWADNAAGYSFWSARRQYPKKGLLQW